MCMCARVKIYKVCTSRELAYYGVYTYIFEDIHTHNNIIIFKFNILYII